MLFNSFEFAIFLPIVLLLYWILPFRKQNYFLLAASYFFYGYWNWRFLSLILISTIVDYIIGLKIFKLKQVDSPKNNFRAKLWLAGSVIVNLGILGYFKYYNFFIDTFTGALNSMGFETSYLYLYIVLPVGISFYTFQTMSYTLDIYRKQMEPTRNFTDFALFVSFFPQLVAGPIERAKALLPRILNKRKFSKQQFFDGVNLIFLGLFKKVFVADNLGPIVDRVFTLGDPTGFETLFGIYAFAFQIYCDFSGYSDIARGCAKCMGFELMVNFRHPFVAANPSDFWQRWHISLSSWLRDYLYFPLGGNRKGRLSAFKNITITMLLGGLWHGASWMFVLWGAYNAVVLILYRLLQPLINKAAAHLTFIPKSIRTFIAIIFVFHLSCVRWLFFRATSPGQIWDMLKSVFIWRGIPELTLIPTLLTYMLPLIVIEIYQIYWKDEDLYKLRRAPNWIRSLVYSVYFYLLVYHGAAAQNFIYFQF